MNVHEGWMMTMMICHAVYLNKSQIGNDSSVISSSKPTTPIIDRKSTVDNSSSSTTSTTPPVVSQQQQQQPSVFAPPPPLTIPTTTTTNNNNSSSNKDVVDISDLLKNTHINNNPTVVRTQFMVPQQQTINGNSFTIHQNNIPSTSSQSPFTTTNQQQNNNNIINPFNSLNNSIQRELNTAKDTIAKLNQGVSQILGTPPISPPNVRLPQPQQPVANLGAARPHPHVLTKVNPLDIYQSNKGVPTWLCDYCSKGYGTSEQFHCSSCGNFDLCRSCIEKSGTKTNPIMLPLEPHNIPSLHAHPLYAMACVDLYGGPEARCDKCLSNVKGVVYHCTICGIKCYNKEPINNNNKTGLFTSMFATKQPAVVAPPPPPKPAPTTAPTTSLFGNFFRAPSSSTANTVTTTAPTISTYNATKDLPVTINVPSHGQPLHKVNSPFEVYEHSEWICDVCRSRYGATEITFYHSPNNYDVCVGCYYKHFQKK
ncbi:hypothetical protein DFA_08113 [Cavenderia fasciculata]|uniref:ZZ-type domain-containing protein n=1 Tax=Cavenderia fasciculata TaxID=261658 RepID=F4Q572_CACFS|nr:uncharacterized protein DFA_08113 [Cavenderia fasciculata]EGG17131.1 hypothetical protein DFA_08113 [Cavenderia fasciculata]|eukprot:XP_004355615.1 hypothetical protein DFA_08113 [Cavenderia fasciculata]